MPTFKDLSILYRNGKLTGELRLSLKKELEEDIKLDKRKHFKLKDGREIDLIALKEETRVTDDPLQRIENFLRANEVI